MGKRDVTVVDHVIKTRESTLLDVVDELLNKGVVADGDVTLGVAGIDLIYLRLSALLCAADRLLPSDRRVPGSVPEKNEPAHRRKPRHRGPSRRRLLK
jgi:gas vesicle protein GvpA/GvpJ/GvpM family